MLKIDTKVRKSCPLCGKENKIFHIIKNSDNPDQYYYLCDSNDVHDEPYYKVSDNVADVIDIIDKETTQYADI